MAEIEVTHKVRQKYNLSSIPGLVIGKRSLELDPESYLFYYYGSYEILVLYPDSECVWEKIKYMIRIPYKRRVKRESQESNRQVAFPIP